VAAVTWQSSWGINTNGAASTVTIDDVTSAGSNRAHIIGVGVKSESTTLTSVIRVGTETATELDREFGSAIEVLVTEYHEPATDAADMVTTLSASRRHCIMAYAMANVNQTTPFGVVSSSSGSAATASSIAPASDTDDLVADFLMTEGDATTHTIGSGQGNEIDVESDSDSDTRIDGNASTELHSGGTSTTMTWSWTTSTFFVVSGLAVKEVAAAAVGPVLRHPYDKAMRTRLVG